MYKVYTECNSNNCGGGGGAISIHIPADILVPGFNPRCDPLVTSRELSTNQPPVAIKELAKVNEYTPASW